MSSRDPSDLEVGELRVLLLQDVSHVIDQVQPKGIFGGDFLQQSTAGDPSPGQGHPGDPGDSLGGTGGGQHQPGSGHGFLLAEEWGEVGEMGRELSVI